MQESQRKILIFLNTKPNATYRDISKHLEKTGVTGIVVYHIKQLIAHGFLKRNNRWALTSKAKQLLDQPKE